MSNFNSDKPERPAEKLSRLGEKLERSGLHCSRSNKKIAGVCGGIADTYNIDSTWVRIGAALFFSVFNIFGAAAYLAAWYLLPQE